MEPPLIYERVPSATWFPAQRITSALNRTLIYLGGTMHRTFPRSTRLIRPVQTGLISFHRVCFFVSLFLCFFVSVLQWMTLQVIKPSVNSVYKVHWPESTFACKCDVHRIFLLRFLVKKKLVSVCASIFPLRSMVRFAPWHVQSKVFICVSVISRRMRKIAPMWSIGF